MIMLRHSKRQKKSTDFFLPTHSASTSLKTKESGEDFLHQDVNADTGIEDEDFGDCLPRCDERYDDPTEAKKNKKRKRIMSDECREKLEEQWMAMYRRLVEYKKTHGTTRVPHECKEDPLLGFWVSRQRRNCRDHSRIDRLNQIGFDWQQLSERNEEHWRKMYNRLVDYKSKHGDTLVPHQYKEDRKLGRWVLNQRNQCKKQERRDLLDKLGFVWKIKESWMTMYQRLATFQKEHGTTQVPHQIDPRLAVWVTKQKSACKKPERRKLMEDIGFEWAMKIEPRSSWMEMYHRLVAYKKKHGTARVPQTCKEDPKLGRWVQAQRRKCKDQDYIDLLDDIGFEWCVVDLNAQKEHWMKMYHRLVAYKKEHGTTVLTVREDKELGLWCTRVRAKCKNQERRNLLNDIGFVWNTLAARNRRTSTSDRRRREAKLRIRIEGLLCEVGSLAYTPCISPVSGNETVVAPLGVLETRHGRTIRAPDRYQGTRISQSHWEF